MHLLDSNRQKKNGIEVLSYLRKKKLPVKIIMLTVNNEIDYLIKAVEVGVDGYVLKDSDSSILVEAIDAVVVKKENYIQTDLIPKLNARLVKRDVDIIKISRLTDREKEVLIEVANGMFNKEIAVSLNISERTVKNHISNIFKKIEVEDRTQAAVFAIRNDIVQIK